TGWNMKDGSHETLAGKTVPAGPDVRGVHMQGSLDLTSPLCSSNKNKRNSKSSLEEECPLNI
ncbi:mCG145152, partial [Mus musculus]